VNISEGTDVKGYESIDIHDVRNTTHMEYVIPQSL
jgi:hypothetical protein